MAGLAMLLSSLYVRYRDVEPIWDVVLQGLFYATPILYTIELLRQKAGESVVQAVLLVNPFAAYVQEAKHLLIDPSHASTAAAMDSYVLLLVPLAMTIGILVLGYRVFAREAPRIAEDL